MTPKEKAIEILIEFISICNGLSKSYCKKLTLEELKKECLIVQKDWFVIKKCAIANISNIIKSVSLVIWKNEDSIDFASFFNYWQEVKQEIENL